MASEIVHDSGYLQPEGCKTHEKRRFTIAITAGGKYALSFSVHYNTGQNERFPGGIVEVFKTRYYRSLPGLNRRLNMFNMEYSPSCSSEHTP